MEKEKETWTSADEKNGCYHNPLIFADVPDPDIIRTRDKNGREAYYMVSTTMHMAPGVPVMKSYDLVNWKTVNYVYYVLEKEDAFRLKNGKNDYACGSWASSIRQDAEGWFYVAFTCESTDKTYIFMTQDIEEGQWHRNEFMGKCYDNGLLFEKDTGKQYIFYSRPLKEKTGEHVLCYKRLFVDRENHVIKMGEECILFTCTNFEKPKLGLWGEGLHVYRRNGYYYIFAIQGVKWQRQEICWRGRSLERTGRWDETDETGKPGEWVCRKVFVGHMVDERGEDYMPSTGIAQGGIIDTPDGRWYSFLFEDYGAVGRIPVLAPMVWGEEGEDKDWPVIGEKRQAGDSFRLNDMQIVYPKPIEGEERESIVYSDDFENRLDCYRPYDIWTEKPERGKRFEKGEYDYNGSVLSPQWQWNHNPDNRLWSLTERPGYLRLIAGEPAATIREARNTLTVRTFGPQCFGEVSMDISGLAEGNTAGLAVYQNQYCYVGVMVEDGIRYIVMRKADCKGDSTGRICEKIPLSDSVKIVYLRAECDFRDKRDEAACFYALTEECEDRTGRKGQCWKPIGELLRMAYDWPDFVGYRFGLFCYTSGQSGGYADFDYFRTGKDFPFFSA